MAWLARHSVTIFLAILTMVLAVMLFWFQRQVTSMELQLTGVTNLVSPDASDSERIVIQFDGRPVPELWIASFRLINNGNTPIRRSDFDAPVKLTLDEADILEVRTSAVAEVKLIDSHHVELPPRLFNPGDFIEFSLIANGSLELLTPSSRIAGVRRLELTTIEAPRPPSLRRTVGIWASGISMALILIALYVLYRMYRWTGSTRSRIDAMLTEVQELVVRERNEERREQNR
ncbi:MAG: hypothetical protein IIC85_02070 [Chloroflexi bacterium]|nr:hypothetical protein [Chloroflexota bacterium]